MRAAFVKAVYECMRADERVCLILAGVGHYAHRQAFDDFPERCYDFGLREQAAIGFAAGLAKVEFIPIVYGIATFVVERAYEQIKVDIGYNVLPVILASVGGSYDYSTEGCTHHAPGDVALLYNVPGIDIYVPGFVDEIPLMLAAAIQAGRPTYIRLNATPVSGTPDDRKMGTGGLATVISIGPALAAVEQALGGQDIILLYVSQVRPFDFGIIREFVTGDRILLVEPYYPVLEAEIRELLYPRQVISLGVKRRFLTDYGSREELAEDAGLSPEAIRAAFKNLIGERTAI